MSDPVAATADSDHREPPLCPRCGYDLSGAVTSWTDHWPLHGTCSECGGEFRWARVLNPSPTERRWAMHRRLHSFEHGADRPIVRFFVTWHRTFVLPGDVLGWVTAKDEINWARLWVFVGLCACICGLTSLIPAWISASKWAHQGSQLIPAGTSASQWLHHGSQSPAVQPLQVAESAVVYLGLAVFLPTVCMSILVAILARISAARRSERLPAKHLLRCQLYCLCSMMYLSSALWGLQFILAVVFALSGLGAILIPLIPLIWLFSFAYGLSWLFLWPSSAIRDYFGFVPVARPTPM